MVFSKKPNPAIDAEREEVRKLLGLDPQTSEFSVVYGSVAANDKEIALLTRSVLEILVDLSSYIDVPAANVEQKRTFPSPAPEFVNGALCAGTYPDSQLAAKTRRCLCRRAVSSRLVLDRRQGLPLQKIVFFYHVSLHAHRHGREARRTDHNDSRWLRGRPLWKGVWRQLVSSENAKRSTNKASRLLKKDFGMLRVPHASTRSAERKIFSDISSGPFVPSSSSGLALRLV